MAVGRAELEIPELEALIKTLQYLDLPKTDPLYRARRELKRALARAQEAREAEEANMRRVRAKRHKIPDEGLMGQGVTHRTER